MIYFVESLEYLLNFPSCLFVQSALLMAGDLLCTARAADFICANDSQISLIFQLLYIKFVALVIIEQLRTISHVLN